MTVAVRTTTATTTTTATEPAPPAERRIGPGEWDTAVADTAGHQLVVGGPGTGKSEFLIRRTGHLVADRDVDPAEVLVLSFGRRGVADLDRRLRRRLTASRPGAVHPPVAVATFHGLAAGLLDRHAAATGRTVPPQVLTGPEQVALVRRLLSTEDPASWSPAFRGLLGSRTFAAEVTDFLLRSAEQMADPAELERMSADRDDWRGLPAFAARYRTELHATGRIDYGMLIAEAAVLLEISSLPLLPHRHILVDEYQDTTLAQVRLLSALARWGDLTAAADPYQSIYSFRGAALHNVARFPDTFPDADGRPGRRLVLTTSFRTPRRILAAAERVAARDLPGAAGPVEPCDADGAVDVLGFEQHTEEAEWIAAEVVRLNREEGIRFGDMGVFVRTTSRFLPELSRALQRRQVPHDTPTARFAEQPAVRFVLDLVAAATAEDPATVDRGVRRLLLGPWFGLSLGSARDLERHRTRTGAGWPATLRERLPGGGTLADLIEDDGWAVRLPAAEGAWHVWSTLPALAAAADPGHEAERESWASFVASLGRWSERRAEATLADHSRLLLDEEFDASPPPGPAAGDSDRLTVTTLHQAKGLELDVVFVADAVEGVFPDLRVRDSLLGVRHLLPDVPHDPAAYRRFRLQEERRLAYTAMTRARRRVVWTATATGFEAGAGIPSRFLALVAGTPTVAEALTRPLRDRPPVTVAEAEARLRRLAADPAVAGPQRLAAIDLLAGGEDHGLRSPERFAGMRERRSDTGVVPARLTLSPSQAESYERCPRRHVLERRLGLGGEPGLHAALGSLVHAVLEAVERRALDRGDAHGSAAEAAADLDARFDDAAFGEGPVPAAWRERAGRLLARLYEAWPGEGRVVAVEHPLCVEIGGVRWYGVADRIEERSGRLVIVDYKTSTTPATAAEAAVSLQLGFYLLAAAADPELARLGEASGAEFWYPGAGGVSIPTRRLDPVRLPEVAERLEAAMRGIAAEQWPPQPSDDCERCPVRSLCPGRPDGREGWVA